MIHTSWKISGSSHVLPTTRLLQEIEGQSPGHAATGISYSGQADLWMRDFLGEKWWKMLVEPRKNHGFYGTSLGFSRIFKASWWFFFLGIPLIWIMIIHLWKITAQEKEWKELNVDLRYLRKVGFKHKMLIFSSKIGFCAIGLKNHSFLCMHWRALKNIEKTYSRCSLTNINIWWILKLVPEQESTTAVALQSSQYDLPPHRCQFCASSWASTKARPPPSGSDCFVALGSLGISQSRNPPETPHQVPEITKLP